ncbi:MAG: hypothetical protein MUC72_07300 [Acidobacteria bacterium]|jgi:hypothetical protein|nr:hypothetical protein [Acidobacteriota bacterium]
MIIAIQAVLILILEIGLQSWLWVAGVPLAFAMAAPVSSARACGRGAAAGGLSWLLAGLYLYLTSGRIIAGRMAVMFGIGAGRGWLLVLLTGLLGALVAAVAAWAGSALRAALRGAHPSPQA